jgi:protein arginine N-methyltransferase 1
MFQLTRWKRVLSSNRALNRAMRAAERRNSFENISLHEEMLADSVRLDAYYAAIERRVKPHHSVVDLGTGTGVLAFFAAAKGPRKIYAIDHSNEMLAYAKATAEANGITNVSFVVSNSRNFRPREPIDIILQEQMGIGLFDEEMLGALIDMRDRCLRPGGHIIPAKFEFFLEPVQLVKQEQIPMIQEQRLHGLRFPRPPIRPGAYFFREIYPRDVDFLLCEPAPVFSFDLSTLTLDHIPKRFWVSKPIARRGQVDGVCIYFKATFDYDIAFSTGPEATKTHWPMLLYRTAARAYCVGEIFEMQVEAPDLSDHYRWSWRIGTPVENVLQS